LKIKSVALFYCCGSAHPLTEEDGKPEDIEKARRKYLDEKAAKYNLQPAAIGFFWTSTRCLGCSENLCSQSNRN
jgi:hypothetical protein